ncbi:MAG: cytochrome c oxidase assembly protein subunit 15 [Pseudohongiellaceae bacterium]|jgi:cytochrome c oxidase assembly protein subunit 15
MNNPNSQALLNYRKMAVITLAAVYFLILVGATVRASGAGMGCPDWPTCFGQWVPPTSESQLPANYQQVYAELGYSDTQFNVVKTWTEYLNRVLGVSIGFMIFITAILSWRTRRIDPLIMRASVAAFLMVGFQGWLGSKVVASNLQPGLITVHMLVALAIVATLLFALAQARRELMEAQPVHSIDPKFERWLGIVLVMTVIQVAMGTQVREMTDFIKEAQGEELRSSWIEAMPWFFYVHRSFSAIVLFSNLWLVRILINSIGWQHTLTRLSIAMIGVIVLSVVSGATLGHLGMPALVQPTHLLAASLLFGLQFLIWMSYRHSKIGSTGRFESKGPVSQLGLNARSASA